MELQVLQLVLTEQVEVEVELEVQDQLVQVKPEELVVMDQQIVFQEFHKHILEEEVEQVGKQVDLEVPVEEDMVDMKHQFSVQQEQEQ